jgi:pimeloyl-ACP methyl ester carboxylesterase
MFLAKVRHSEAFAHAYQTLLLPRDLRVRLPARRADDVVLLVHGFLATAGVLRPLRRYLERTLPIETASFTHLPHAGIVGVANAIARIVDRLPPVRIHLVGHSLGGVAIRYYVQELGGEGRIAQTISIASPFHGARTSLVVTLPFIADLRKESPILERIRDGASRSITPHTSIFGMADRTGVGPWGASLGIGEDHAFDDRGHNAILYDDAVLERVATTIRARIPR